MAHESLSLSVRWSLVFAALASLSGCYAPPRVGDPSNALAAGPLPPDQINWPEKYRPEDASFFVHNEIEIQAPPEAIWEVIIQAETWPSWYEGASKVKVQGREDGRLAPDAVFTWDTMGLSFTSTIKEFKPPHRLSWESRKSTIQGYHAWLIIPTAAGCKLVTDESQHGFMTWMQKAFVPGKLRRLHDVWLAEIKKKSEAQGGAVSLLLPGD
jgi:uncharacterized protein YndB with AHSA1/START domain